MTQIPDQKARDTALDISKSFIIQAPAGSGKTSLLTQRYLSLLSKVQNPEEIIAITFTKKAAAEMQERIIEALLLGKEEEEPKEAYLKKTYDLARAALKQNELHQWQLFRNKNRLRVLTIDAFCLFLTNKMPLLSKAIPFSFIADDPHEIYRQAALKTLKTAMKDKNLIESLKKIQEHMGNNQTLLVDLFVMMLQKREQWLVHVLSARTLDRNYFKEVLEHIQNELIEKSLSLMPETLIKLIEHIINYQASFTKDPIFNVVAPYAWDEFSFLKSVSELLLSSTDTPRKRFTKKEGFPPATFFKNTEDKINAKETKEKLSEITDFLENNPTLLDIFKQIKLLPLAPYSEKQWDVLSALLKLLPLLAAELSVIFSKTSKIDFNEISMQALNALGDETPTELALYLDYEINHLLIDEFQDTSKKQYYLLERLTESWYDGDGKTLFLVGDPMQSIYRFREADVGLFLYIKQFGINQIQINSLQLSCNFRSSAGLINEVNTICGIIFPHQEQIKNGAVCYTPSQTINNNNEQAIYGIKANSKEEESFYIEDYIKKNPNENIAVLIRSRSQLKKIVPLLKAKNIQVEGINLEKLSTTYTINLLLSLIKFIVNPTDILSLTSLLNSPLCGINTYELELLFKEPFSKSLTLLTQLEKKITLLSSSSSQRVMKIVLIFKHCHHHAYRKNISEIARDIWSHLDGDCIVNETLEEDVNQFWILLDKNKKWPLDLFVFERQLQLKYSEKKSKCNVKIMTIHRSKGLEFDTVILPSINYASVDRNTDLLSYLEVNEDFLLSPIHSAFDDKDPMVTYIKSIEKQKDFYERQRLFYVAVTRAKTKLILIDSSKMDRKAVKGSFLSYVENNTAFTPIDSETENDHARKKEKVNQPTLTKRLKQTYFIYPPLLSFIQKSNDIPKTLKKESNKILGEFIHQQLFYMAESLDINLSMTSNVTYIKDQLLSMGLVRNQLQAAIATFQMCTLKIKECPIALWIFKQRAYSNNEYQLNTPKGFYIIDRTFLDDNIRWIIDYKITTDINKNKDEYIDQLNNYASLFSTIEKKAIKLILYYPLLKQKVEWEYKKEIAE